MNEYQKKLNYYLRYLKKSDRELELQKYSNLNKDTDLVELANKIYAEKGLKTRILKDISFTDAIGIMIDKIKLKDKNISKKIILFILYILLLIIVIKIPFIYVRDITLNLFNEFFNSELKITIWNLIFEGLYAVTTIVIIINVMKKKAILLEKI